MRLPQSTRRSSYARKMVDYWLQKQESDVLNSVAWDLVARRVEAGVEHVEVADVPVLGRMHVTDRSRSVFTGTPSLSLPFPFQSSDRIGLNDLSILSLIGFVFKKRFCFFILDV